MEDEKKNSEKDFVRIMKRENDFILGEYHGKFRDATNDKQNNSEKKTTEKKDKSLGKH